MKKTIALIVFIACFVLLSGIAFADSLCTDTDDARDYDRKGSVKYGITSEEDRCVLGPKADVRTETSMYLKEYFCADDKRNSDIVDCSREGYERCYQGACVGGKKGASTSNGTNYTLPPELPQCGDKKVNSIGEQCDPPGKICYTETFDIGLCSAKCQCDVKLKAEGGVVNKTENATTSAANETTPAANLTLPKETPKTEVPAETPKEEPKIEPEDIAAVPVKEEAEPKGFFSAIWSWIKGIFS